MNRSQYRRSGLPPKPEFALTGIIVGVLAGFGAELMWHRDLMVMQAGGAAGGVLGVAFEGVRYAMRRRRFLAARRADGGTG